MSHDGARWRFFAYLNLFMFSMLLLVLADNFLLIFAAWELVGLSSYSLIGFWYTRPSPGPRVQEGVHRQPRRRRGLRARDHGDLGRPRDAEHRRGQRAHRHPRPAVHHRHRAAALLRRGRQERAVPAPRLAAGRDGGPHPGQRPHPRGDDGERGRLPGRPDLDDLRPRAEAMVVVASIGTFTAILAASIALHADRHQARPRVLHALAAGLHVRGARRRSLDGRHLPPHDARLLQGPALPRLRLGHPRGGGRAGHEQDGRPAEEDPDHALDDAHRNARAVRDPAARGLLLEGRHPRRELYVRVHLGVRHRPRRGGHDRVLHVPAHGEDVLRLAVRVREVDLGPHPRRSLDDAPSARPPRDPLGLHRDVPRSPARRLAHHGVAQAGLRAGRGDPCPHCPRVPALRDRRRAHRHQRRGGHARRGRGRVALRLLPLPHPPRAPSPA